MKKRKDSFWKFDWLVQTSPIKLLVLMAFIPFLYLVWLFKVGQLSERKLSVKPNFLFRFLLVVFSIGIILAYSMLIFEEYFDLDKYFNYIFGLVYLCFIYIDIYITQVTSKLENKTNYSSGITIRVGRFFILSTLILGAYLLQPTYNKLFLKK